MAKYLALALLPFAIGCYSDTLHYELRDPHNVTVYVDGQPVLDTSDESPHYDMLVRTGADTLASSGFTLQHTPLGLFAKMDTTLPLLHGELLELVGNDGWVAALPLNVPRRTVADEAQLSVTPRLTEWSVRHTSGYTTSLETPRTGDHVVTIATPRDNVVAVERRGNPGDAVFAGVMLVPGSTFALVGSTFIFDSHRASSHAVGGVGIAVGATIDAVAIWELVRGHRRTKLPLP